MEVDEDYRALLSDYAMVVEGVSSATTDPQSEAIQKVCVGSNSSSEMRVGVEPLRGRQV